MLHSQSSAVSAKNVTVTNHREVIKYFIMLVTIWTLYLLFLYDYISSIHLGYVLTSLCKVSLFLLPILWITKLNGLRSVGISYPNSNTFKIGFLVASIYLVVGTMLNIYVGGCSVMKLPDLRFWLFNFIISCLVEEIVFRGFIFQRLRSVSSFRLSAIISSILFLIIHFPGWIIFSMESWIVVSISIFILGIVLAYVKERTESVWACYIIHAFNNLAAHCTS